MLVVSYKINDALVGNYERDGSGCSAAIVIGVTFVITGINVVWAIFQYIWFSGCSYNILIITSTILVALSFYIIVMFRTRPDASILTSSIVVVYCLYL